VPQDRTPHPTWCDKPSCTLAEDWPYGHHQSSSQVVAADSPVTTVAELHLVSTIPGLSPHTLVILDLDLDLDTAHPAGAQPESSQAESPCGTPSPFPLTLAQARELHTALDKLLAAAASPLS
jgi:hypothetical protein